MRGLVVVGLALPDVCFPGEAERHVLAQGDGKAAWRFAGVEDAAAFGQGLLQCQSHGMFESALDILRRPPSPTVWLVRDLVTLGGTTIISGEPKTAKTWVEIEIGQAVSTGTLAFGKYVTGAPRKVASFFAEDMAESFRARFAALAAGRGMKPEDAAANFYAQPRGRSLDLTRLEDLVADTDDRI